MRGKVNNMIRTPRRPSQSNVHVAKRFILFVSFSDHVNFCKFILHLNVVRLISKYHHFKVPAIPANLKRDTKQTCLAIAGVEKSWVTALEFLSVNLK